MRFLSTIITLPRSYYSIVDCPTFWQRLNTLLKIIAIILLSILGGLGHLNYVTNSYSRGLFISLVGVLITSLIVSKSLA